MNRKWLVWLVAGLVCAGWSLAEEPRTLQESGRLAIFYRGEECGWEQYALYRQGKHQVMETESKLTLPRGAGNILFEYRTVEVMDEGYTPISYQDDFAVNGRQSYIYTTFNNGTASDNALMGGQTLTRTAKVSPQFRILEEAVYSLYLPLYKKFKQSAAPKHNIPVYIPKFASELKAEISFSGTTVVTTPLGDMKLNRYFVSLGSFQGATGEVSEKGALMKVTIPRQEIELVRDLAWDLKGPAAPRPAPPGPPAPAEPMQPAPTQPAPPATPPSTPPDRTQAAP